MSRPAIIVMVGLAAYCLLDLVISAIVAIAWRTRTIAPQSLPPVARARRVVLCRMTPALLSGVISLFVVVPAFAIFEPVHDGEPVGPVLIILAAAATLHLTSAIARGAHSVWLTRSIGREWFAASSAIASSSRPPIFVVDAQSPIVALVGVFTPRLIAARSVIDACSRDEFDAIVAHERGHLAARDNFKRWMMEALPDTLRWTRIHAEMLEVWHHAAEDAADDVATRGDAKARADLAALLLKVVRLAPHPIWKQAVVSPFIEQDGLERRVRRLIGPELETAAPVDMVPPVFITTLVTAIVATLKSPSVLEAIYVASEQLVLIGR